MTRERYLSMCEQMGKEPDPKEMPPDFSDLPTAAVDALNIFHMLGDRLYPDIGYVGKDYTNLPVLIDVYGIEDKELLLEILHLVESRAIKQSQDYLKREREKLKRSK
jgi:hypothetical protein